jgi:hypothetical protein
VARHSHARKRAARQLHGPAGLDEAQVLVQLMPATAALFKARNLYDSVENLKADTRYLRSLDAEWKKIDDRHTRLRKYVNDPVTTLGYCNGKVAVFYTKNIIDRFEMYRAVIPEYTRLTSYKS